MFCDDRDKHLPYQPGSTKVISKRHIKVVPLSSILPRQNFGVGVSPAALSGAHQYFRFPGQG